MTGEVYVERATGRRYVVRAEFRDAAGAPWVGLDLLPARREGWSLPVEAFDQRFRAEGAEGEETE